MRSVLFLIFWPQLISTGQYKPSFNKRSLKMRSSKLPNKRKTLLGDGNNNGQILKAYRHGLIYICMYVISLTN